MTYRLRIRSDARLDIRSAREWYERQGSGLGERFGEELAASFSSIEAQPLVYATIFRDVRRAMTRRFPYAIYFVVERDRIPCSVCCTRRATRVFGRTAVESVARQTPRATGILQPPDY